MLKTKYRFLILSFDYELFLGKDSGSVEKCLIEPTQLIIDLLDRHGLRHALFFVDTTYLCKLSDAAVYNEKAAHDFNLITKQLQQLIEKGHYIYPHLHPHWMDAVYSVNNNSWDLSKTDKYRFHNISIAEREKIFLDSITILQRIIRPIRPNYIINGYRAGGLSIQPFSDFKPLFEKHNIKFEFSVLPDTFELSALGRNFDFRNAPHNYIYRFDEDVVKRNVKGKFYQIPISKIKVTALGYFIDKLVLKLFYSLGYGNSIGRGVGAQFSEQVYKSDNNFESASIEWMQINKVFRYRKYLAHHPAMHFMSHPKMLSLLNINAFNTFISSIKRKYFLVTDFKAIKPKKSSILICSFVSPPQAGIGGRRWIKFAKYLKAMGYRVIVLSAELEADNLNSPWIDDAKGIEILRLPIKYPKVLSSNSDSIYSKLDFKVTKFVTEKMVDGSIYDKAIFWEQQYMKAVNQIVKAENIDCLINTAAPFNLLYYGAKMKNKYPSLKIISDLRDPWTWGEMYGFSNLSVKQRLEEERKEAFVLKHSDYLTCPVEPMRDFLTEKYPNYAEKVKLLEHGYDIDEVSPIPRNRLRDSKLKLIYGGTLYENTEAELETLLRFLKENRDHVEVDFYLSSNPYLHLFNQYKSENIRIYKSIPSKQFFEKLNAYDFYLTISNERIKDYLSTKFYEIFYHKVPILYIGPKSLVSDKLIEFGLGIFVANDRIEERMRQVLMHPEIIAVKEQLDLGQFEYSNITKRLETLINS